ncbi:MAG: LEA type 2 family protein [Methanoregula sp.]|jgi:LEA14-like dessication related protein|nr:LEA type 2 family protein [Methanoregula sp.]
MMRLTPHCLVFLFFAVFLLICGCTSEPPIKEPVVSVSDISLADVSLKTMTVNTTVFIDNPNQVGGHLNTVMFDVWYLDGGKPKYLGHGEQANIAIIENGNTRVEIPVIISNLQALYALGSLSQKGSIILMVNGSAFVDVKVTSWEMKFEDEREFAASEFDAYLPVDMPGSVNVTKGIETAKDIWLQIST